jgi:mRNA interferase HigB
MRIISKKALVEFWQRPGCADSKPPFETWCRELKAAAWQGPADIKVTYGSASILKEGRVVFNIRPNFLLSQPSTH